MTTGQFYYYNTAAEWVEKHRLTPLSASMIRAHDAPIFSLQPPHPSHCPNSSLKASSGACESGLPVLGWMQPRTHLLNPPPCSEFTVALYWQAKLAAASSLLPLPHPNCPCLLWFGQPKNSDTLYTHTSLYCVVFNGILQVKSVLLQQKSAEMYNLEATPVKFEHNTYRPYCLSVCKVNFSRFS